ncbi:hypothetical protein EBR96_07120, partial [bacterium]|nr:hypothetical protein [bacterium]
MPVMTKNIFLRLVASPVGSRHTHLTAATARTTLSNASSVISVLAQLVKVQGQDIKDQLRQLQLSVPGYPLIGNILGAMEGQDKTIATISEVNERLRESA